MSLTGGPRERALAKQVNVEMRHTFACVRSAIDDNTVTSFVDPDFLREITGDEQKFSEQRAICFTRRP
jgi:hypothetical protein